MGPGTCSGRQSIDAGLRNRGRCDWTDHSLQVGSTEFPGSHSSPSVSLSAHWNDVAVPQSLSATAGTLLELLTTAQERV